jgi:hypothetical protein
MQRGPYKIRIASKEKVLAFLNRSGVLRNGAEKQANSFHAKGKVFSICSFSLQIEISFLDKHS